MVQFSTEQKVAARALLDFHFPSPELVAAAVGTTRQSISTWSKDKWTFADRRLAGALEAQQRHRIKMLTSFGRNVPPDVRSTDMLQMQDDLAASDVLECEAGAGWVEPVAQLNADGQPMSLSESLQSALKRLTEQLVHRVHVDRKSLGREQVDAVLALLRLSERMEAAMQAEQSRNRQQHSQDLTAALRKIDARIEELARRYAQDYLQEMIEAGDLVPAPHTLETEQPAAGQGDA